MSTSRLLVSFQLSNSHSHVHLCAMRSFAIMFAFARFFLFKWIYVHKRVDKHLVMYRKMFKVGVGLEAVHQKMKKDGNLERMEGGE